MTIKQVADRLEISASTVYALVASGKLLASRHGVGRGCIRISEDQVQDYMDRHACPQEERSYKWIT